MKDFLFEIGVEPLPARFVPGALAQFKANAEALLRDNRLAAQSVRALGTYRRLALLIEGLAEKSEPLHREALGPRLSAAKDAQGNWTPAALGFAKSQGVTPEELSVVPSPKGEVVCAKVTFPGEAAEKVLLRGLSALIGSLEFPKTMVWNDTKTRFGRPIRGLLALWGIKPLSFAFAGVKSGRTVIGLSALGSRPAKVPAPGRYVPALKAATILADPEERRLSLDKTLDLTVRRVELKVDKDPALIEETVFLTEHPVAVHGQFDERYLKLPAQLLSVVLKHQLKFFPVLDGKGRLTAHFVGVRDGISEGQKEVQEGFERVLAARLADALFFFEKDLKTTLEDKRARLKDLSFLNQLGNMLEKSERVEALAGRIAERLAASGARADAPTVTVAARLAYADLVSEVVREFPELQGAMGGVYAAQQSVPEAAARAISDFYLPVSPESDLPRSLEGALASLAGKLDTLAAHFGLGNIPSGSEDPFALRRQAVGAVRIVLDNRLALPLDSLLEEHMLELRNRYPEAGIRPVESVEALGRFLWQRVEAVCAEKGFPADEVRAVSEGAFRNLPRALRRLEALHKTRGVPEFETLAAAFKRAANILRQAKVEKGSNHLDPQRFQQQEESALWLELGKVSDAVAEKLTRDEFEASLQELARLKDPLDRFFEKVMVMAEDPALKANRLALLSRLVALMSSVADLSKLQ